MNRAVLALIALSAIPATAATIMTYPSFTIIPAALWGVSDTEPMIIVYGPTGPSFSRLGDEQCLDKLLGTVPCDEELELDWGDPTPPTVMMTPPTITSVMTPPTTITTPPGIIHPSCCVPPPPPCCSPPPPPSPVGLEDSLPYLLAALAGLVLWRKFT